jgi:hypothetical protein
MSSAFIGGLIQRSPAIYKPAVGIILLGHLRSAHKECGRSSAAAHRDLPLAPGVMIGGVIGLLSGLTGTGGRIFLLPAGAGGCVPARPGMVTGCPLTTDLMFVEERRAARWRAAVYVT